MSKRLQPGDQAPGFTLPTPDGDELSLESLRGGKVVLYFYPAAMTPGCTTEACDFRDSLGSLRSVGYTVLGVSPDDPEKLAQFREQEALTFPLLADPDHAVCEAYGAWGEKQVDGRTVTGVIRSTFALDEQGRVETAMYDVQARGHVAELRQVLGVAGPGPSTDARTTPGRTPRMTELSDALADVLDERLADADRELRLRYPGNPGTRQPVHTVYVPADRFTAEAHREWGAAAVELLDRHAPTAEALAGATGMPVPLVDDVYGRVREKLAREPIEDLRVDFEDGYGQRSDEDEDRAATETAVALAAVARTEGAPPFLGIRFKSFEAPTRRRGLRTLDIVLTGLLAAGGLPEGLVLTLPKVTSVAQVAAMVEVCARLEQAHGLPAGRLGFEIQVETPQAILGADGTATVAGMISAAEGRCTGLHYGTYDYSAALGITAAHQTLEHPAADHAKAVMQVAAAGTGVRLSDGSTNVLPTGDQDAVHAAWRLHARLVARSLERGYYQGWDMHPGHLPTRYLATYSFFRASLPATAARIRAYLGRVEGGVMDEPATAQALAGAVLRGLDCGAVTPEEAGELTGVDRARLEGLARRVGI